MIIGYIILIFAGICQGSFGLGYKKYSPFSWEVFWGVYNILCLIVMTIWTIINEPRLFSVMALAEPQYIIVPILCGIVWGLSTLAFSKSVILVGMSMCFGVNMGVSAAVGSIIPFIRGQKDILPVNLSLFLLSIIITLLGIAVITKAGMNRDKDKEIKNMKLGILLAIVSGICSGMMNVGFDYAAVITEGIKSDIAKTAVQWFLVLGGGNVAAALCCLVLALKNKTLNTVFGKRVPRRICILFLTAIVWFAALALYGIASNMTSGAGLCWLMFNAIALVVSNFWGIKMGEWSGFAKEKRLLFIGDAILALSWVIIYFI